MKVGILGAGRIAEKMAMTLEPDADSLCLCYSFA